MNKFIISCIVCLLLATNVQGQSTNELGQEIKQHLEDNKIGKIHKEFSSKTKRKFRKIMLVGFWKSLQKNNGALTSVGEVAESVSEGKTVLTFPLDFEKISLNMVVTTNEKQEIIGLVFTPLAYETPEWAKNKIFGKERIKVKTDSFILPGELMVPENCQQCPVVILVHGSGPSDRNEGSAMSPNRLFQDLAYGFALNGIATIRYDKRTLVYQKELQGSDSFTVYEETIDDAVSAVHLSKSYSFIDTSRIYILGHSLGAYVSPLIAAEDTMINGIIMMAGPYRPLYEIIPEQYEYLYGLDGSISKKEQKAIDQMYQEVLFIRGETSEVSTLKLLGTDDMMPYYQQMRAYQPEQVIQNLDCRVLITQGDRDYQVRHQTEYNAYKAALSDQAHVDFKLIPGANHQLIWGQEPSVPSEYFKPGHPDFDLITEISDWIKEK